MQTLTLDDVQFFPRKCNFSDTSNKKHAKTIWAVLGDDVILSCFTSVGSELSLQTQFVLMSDKGFRGVHISQYGRNEFADGNCKSRMSGFCQLHSVPWVETVSFT